MEPSPLLQLSVVAIEKGAFGLPTLLLLISATRCASDGVIVIKMDLQTILNYFESNEESRSLWLCAKSRQNA